MGAVRTLVVIVLLGAPTAAAVWLGATFLRRLRRDTGRVGDGFLLLATIVMASWAALMWSVRFGVGELAVGVILLIVALSPLVFLGVVVLLLANGVRVMRREGVAATTALPAVAGTTLVLVPTALLWSSGLSSAHAPALVATLVTVGLFGSYVLVHLLAYGAYAVAHGRLAVPPDTRVVAVLGCGLAGGERVTPLLAARLEKALQVRRETDDPDAVVLVASGGQGADEKISEAEAMARYLRDKGVPADAILVEDRSTTTRENLLFTREVLASAGLADAPMVVCTNDFHAIRTAALARGVDGRARVVGAPTAGYYRPAAVLREFVALMAQNPRRHLVVLVAIALVAAAVAWS